MKKFFVSIVFIFISVIVNAQAIGISGAYFPIDSSAILEIQSTKKGVLFSRMTETQRDSISNPALSLVIYNTTKNCFEFYAYGDWHRLACMCPLPGDEYEGGIIAYLFQEGDSGYVAGDCHGIISATEDLSNSKWSNITNTTIGTTKNEIGEGQNNTNEIIAQAGHTLSASQSCNDLDTKGYQDWFLPSLDELGKLYDNNDVIGGFNKTLWVGEYWSSSEHQGGNSNTHAQYVQMWDGVKMALNKSSSLKVRCIRYF